MKAVKWVFAFLAFILIATLAHYYLPDRDIVQIVDTDVKRMDISDVSPFWDRPDVGTNTQMTRDVRFIYTVKKNGKSMTYRNEDTGWSFPPYFKFDSSDVSGNAANLARDKEQWVAVRHYGWRIKLFSIFPNATSIKKVSGPDALLIPWFNIVFLGLVAIFIFWILRLINRWKTKNVDPITDRIGEEFDEAGEAISKRGTAMGRAWRKVFGTTKPRK
jgi:hypothetical protein